MMPLGWTWPFLRKGQIWENANIQDGMFWRFGLNIGNKSYLNKIMTIYEYERPRWFFYLWPRALMVWQFQTVLKKAAKPIVTVCSLEYSRTTVIIQMMALGWLWPFHRKVKYGWLVGCFGFKGPLRQSFSLYRAVSQREREREKKRQMSKTTPTRTYCKRNRPLPYYIHIVGRPDTGSLPRTIAPPDHPRSNMRKMLVYKVSWKVFKVGLKTGIFSCLQVYLRVCEYKRPRSFFDLWPRTS